MLNGVKVVTADIGIFTQNDKITMRFEDTMLGKSEFQKYTLARESILKNQGNYLLNKIVAKIEGGGSAEIGDLTICRDHIYLSKKKTLNPIPERILVPYKYINQYYKNGSYYFSSSQHSNSIVVEVCHSSPNTVFLPILIEYFAKKQT